MPTTRHRHVGRPDNELNSLHPEGRFVLALLQQWVSDALDGDLAAIRDMHQPPGPHSFDSWCSWLDINPDTIRARVRAHYINRHNHNQQGAYPTP